MKDAGVTTIIYTGDPLMPSSITKEATAQNFNPEWIIGPDRARRHLDLRPHL